MKLLVESNNILSLITKSSKGLRGMKDRVKRGYEGEYTDHVHAYNEYGFHLQDKSAHVQLEHLSFDHMNVLDVGCGTAALGYVAIEQGAKAVACGDISYLMLQNVMAKDGSLDQKPSRKSEASGCPE
jgi:ubiquinone/menaquinone biosynthesis C-methylase UbiE